MKLFLTFCLSFTFVMNAFSQTSWQYSVGFVITDNNGNSINSNDLYKGSVRVYSWPSSHGLEYVHGLNIFSINGVTHNYADVMIGCINGQGTTIVSLSGLGEARLIVTNWPKEPGFYQIQSKPSSSVIWSPSFDAAGRHGLYALSIPDWGKFKEPKGAFGLKEALAGMELKQWKSSK